MHIRLFLSANTNSEDEWFDSIALQFSLFLFQHFADQDISLRPLPRMTRLDQSNGSGQTRPAARAQAFTQMTYLRCQREHSWVWYKPECWEVTDERILCRNSVIKVFSGVLLVHVVKGRRLQHSLRTQANRPWRLRTWLPVTILLIYEPCIRNDFQ